MGAGLSKRTAQHPLYASEPTECPASGNPARQPAPEPATTIKLLLDVANSGEGPVRVLLAPEPDLPPIPDEDLLVRVQLQESFSPGVAVHLILLPTDRKAEGELSHDVKTWTATMRDSTTEESPKSSRIRSRLVDKLSPRGKSPKSKSPKTTPAKSPAAKQ